ncbi:hypothetical protein PsYK624_172210 [Phanerochaete sordida]|uniref:Uncharacterized protein n=1 Tax=Phanerochaete sordida TaxID=48140 RepID=A0A9P3LMW3_9APHY|nr:hypothetical protein PsYK624_172210 [Phanerochaete sordida]
MCAARRATLAGARVRLWLAAEFAPASSSRSPSRGRFDALLGACLLSFSRSGESSGRPGGHSRPRRWRGPRLGLRSAANESRCTALSARARLPRCRS